MRPLPWSWWRKPLVMWVAVLRLIAHRPAPDYAAIASLEVELGYRPDPRQAIAEATRQRVTARRLQLELTAPPVFMPPPPQLVRPRSEDEWAAVRATIQSIASGKLR